MDTKYGFTKMSIQEFKTFLSHLKIARTIRTIQQHHTYIPSYLHFKGNNHFELQKSMKNTHINQNGWADIGQHISIFPDGTIMTGRSFEKSPACIFGNNANSFCIENIGNFDKGFDQMTTKQKDCIVKVTALLCEKFKLVPSTKSIVYHHWFDLISGVRNNGTKNNKSCPGTNFFGGNKVNDCEKNFIPLVKQITDLSINTINPLKYVYVTADSLNIRNGAGTKFTISKEITPVTFGSILRVYEEKNNWYKIAHSAEHWVSSKYTKSVKKALVNTADLNVRSGYNTSFPVINQLKKNDEVFIYETKNGWAKISLNESWVNQSYLKITA